MYDFVPAVNTSSRLHIDANLIVTQERLLEPKPINPEYVGHMFLRKGSIILQQYAVPKTQRTKIRAKDAAQKHVV